MSLGVATASVKQLNAIRASAAPKSQPSRYGRFEALAEAIPPGSERKRCCFHEFQVNGFALRRVAPRLRLRSTLPYEHYYPG